MRLVIYSLNFKTSYIFYAYMGYEIMKKHKQYKVCMTLISILNKSKRTKITGRPHKEAVNFDEIQVYNMVILLPIDYSMV